jgi:BirA family transcriptional regulator, biotin operon repressor / biotin---[acetyl-CoA-carboxylase] ligase
MSYTILEYKTLDSTNTFLKQYHSALSHLTFLRSRHQTAGRGQFDRTWSSNPNENILVSVLLKDIPLNRVEHHKKWIEQGIVTFLNNHGYVTTFKAPNDIYVNSKKICGILTETQSDALKFTYVVIGVGLNVNQTEFKGLNATSMRLESNKHYDIDALFEALIQTWLTNYGD